MERIEAAHRWPGACNGQTCQSIFIRVEGSGLKCGVGDSGGPLFSNDRAYGIYMGQSASGSTCYGAIYTAINYISGLNLSVLTG